MAIAEINRTTIQLDHFVLTQLACMICPIHPAPLLLINHRLSTDSTRFRSTRMIRITLRDFDARIGNPQAITTIGLGASHLAKRSYTEVTQNRSRRRALSVNPYGPTPTPGLSHTHPPLHQIHVIQSHLWKQSARSFQNPRSRNTNTNLNLHTCLLTRDFYGRQGEKRTI